MSGCAVGLEMAMIKADGEAHGGGRGIASEDELVRLWDACRRGRMSSKNMFDKWSWKTLNWNT